VPNANSGDAYPARIAFDTIINGRTGRLTGAIGMLLCLSAFGRKRPCASKKRARPAKVPVPVLPTTIEPVLLPIDSASMMMMRCNPRLRCMFPIHVPCVDGIA